MGSSGTRGRVVRALAGSALAAAMVAAGGGAGCPGRCEGSAGDATPPALEAGASGRRPESGGVVDAVVDPYCGVRLSRGEAAASVEHRGRTYYFCLEDHREAFLRNPERYLAAPARPVLGPAPEAGGGDPEAGPAARD